MQQNGTSPGRLNGHASEKATTSLNGTSPGRLNGHVSEKATTSLNGTSLNGTSPEKAPKTSLPVVNLAEANFECTYGRGCPGACCQNGRPGLYPDEDERIQANLERILAMLRPEARDLVEKQGYVTRRLREGRYPMVRVLDGWCVFFNEG